MGAVGDKLPRSQEKYREEFALRDCEGKMIISWLSGSG